MALPSEPSEFVPQVTALLVGERIDPSYLAFVRRHVAEPDASWRWCCGSNCDPCVERLGRVVDAARRLLGIAPIDGRPQA